MNFIFKQSLPNAPTHIVFMKIPISMTASRNENFFEEMICL